MKKPHIGFIGTGIMGAPMAGHLSKAGYMVTIYDTNRERMERVVAEMKAEFGDRVNDINGARVTFDEGWGLVRPSSNLPELVLVFEGRTADAMTRYKDMFRERLARHPDVGTVWHNE